MPHRLAAFRLRRSKAVRDKMTAVFLLGLGLFTPPLVMLFMTPARVAGIPLLYLYIFVAWIVLAVLLALIAEKGGED